MVVASEENVSKLSWRRSDTPCEYTETTYKKAGVICFDNCGRHLLVKEKTSNKWGFPKGSVEKNESLVDCALREFREETGYTLEKRQIFIGKTFKCHKCMYFIVYINTTDDAENSLIPYTMSTENIDRDEIVDMFWVNLSDVNPDEMNSGLKMYKDDVVFSRRRRSNQLCTRRQSNARSPFTTCFKRASLYKQSQKPT